MSSNLVRVLPDLYHPFPNRPMKQDEYFGSIGRVKHVQVKRLAQKDGSKFKCFYWKQSAFALTEQVEKLQLNLGKITPPSEAFGLDVIHSTPRHELKYYAYWTHTFLNGVRVIPVVVRKGEGACYNISEWFQDYIPEDDLGVLLPSPDDLSPITTPHLGVPELIEYQSWVRLCHCCGVVSDQSRKKTDPWISYRKQVYYQRRKAEQSKAA